jgi:NAD(P)-dependent dehydrogenase (short-subunit alcohol dehydrogenase family)
MKLLNETALVTGSTSGIGKSIARHLLEEGCKVALCSRNEEHVQSALTELKPAYGEAVAGFRCDVTNPTDLRETVERTATRFGSLRILVANAGISLDYGPFEFIDPVAVECQAGQVIGTNLIGMMNAIAAVLPIMKKQDYGRIITLSGGGADRPIDNMTIYSASKGGVLAFSKCLALELGKNHKDIKLNIYQPGMLRTGLTARVNVVPGWRSGGDVQEDLNLAIRYLGANLVQSTLKVIPYVMPSCKANGRVFRGFSMVKLIGGAMKLQKLMKARQNLSGAPAIQPRRV